MTINDMDTDDHHDYGHSLLQLSEDDHHNKENQHLLKMNDNNKKHKITTSNKKRRNKKNDIKSSKKIENPFKISDSNKKRKKTSSHSSNKNNQSHNKSISSSHSMKNSHSIKDQQYDNNKNNINNDINHHEQEEIEDQVEDKKKSHYNSSSQSKNKRKRSYNVKQPPEKYIKTTITQKKPRTTSSSLTKSSLESHKKKVNNSISKYTYNNDKQNRSIWSKFLYDKDGFEIIYYYNQKNSELFLKKHQSSHSFKFNLLTSEEFYYTYMLSYYLYNVKSLPVKEGFPKLNYFIDEFNFLFDMKQLKTMFYKTKKGISVYDTIQYYIYSKLKNHFKFSKSMIFFIYCYYYTEVSSLRLHLSSHESHSTLPYIYWSNWLYQSYVRFIYKQYNDISNKKNLVNNQIITYQPLVDIIDSLSTSSMMNEEEELEEYNLLLNASDEYIYKLYNFLYNSNNETMNELNLFIMENENYNSDHYDHENTSSSIKTKTIIDTDEEEYDYLNDENNYEEYEDDDDDHDNEIMNESNTNHDKNISTSTTSTTIDNNQSSINNRVPLITDYSHVNLLSDDEQYVSDVTKNFSLLNQLVWHNSFFLFSDIVLRSFSWK